MRTLFRTIIVASLGMMVISCSDIKFGDGFLGSQPESSGATLVTMFNSAINADKVLTTAYTFLPYGLPTGTSNTNNKLGGNVLEAITDLHHSNRNSMNDGPTNLYYNGSLSSRSQAGSEAYRFGTSTEYSAIRYAWIYIENAHRIPDISQKMLLQRVAEAKMIIAIAYSELLRYVGGVPILKRSVNSNDEMVFERNTFAQTVDYIVQLINEAKNDLPWVQSSTDDGRMTKAGALALKLRVLCFAASPTFNSTKKWHDQANAYTCYEDYNLDRWRVAVEAGVDFFEELDRQGYYRLVQPQQDNHEARRLAYRKGFYNRGSSEVLISTRKGYGVGTHSAFLNEGVFSGPTLNYVDMFPWEDGSDFPDNFDWELPSKQPFFRSTDQGMVPTRDPRLYETVAVAGDRFMDGTFAPVYSNNPYYRGGTGFLQMKFIMREPSDRVGLAVHWPYLRLSEVMLSYAEAINEYEGKPNTKAYDCVNEIRRRIGLSELPSKMTKTEFREAVLRERALELGFEEVRWFDLIRWGRKDDFTKPLYGLLIVGNDANNPTSFQFKRFSLQPRHWSINWDSKWYISPIPSVEINKEYGMIQNPGW